MIKSQVCFIKPYLFHSPQSSISKLPPDLLITFLVSHGSSSTKYELADFFDLDASMPTEAALIRQRAKLKPKPSRPCSRSSIHWLQPHPMGQEANLTLLPQTALRLHFLSFSTAAHICRKFLYPVKREKQSISLHCSAGS